MKNLFYQGLLVFLLLFGNNKLFSQNTDSLFAEREKIILQGVDYTRGMFHWNFLRSFNSKIDAGYEKRINLNFSAMSNIVWDFTKQHGGLIGSGGVRYYYNLESRIIKRWKKKQVKTSCFSADYFEADLNVGGNWGTQFPDKNDVPPGIIVGPTLKVGMQRKLWKFVFIDGFLGYNFILQNKG